MEQGHYDHFVTLAAHHPNGRDTLLPGQQGVKREVIVLAVKRVLGDVYIAALKQEGSLYKS